MPGQVPLPPCATARCSSGKNSSSYNGGSNSSANNVYYVSFNSGIQPTLKCSVVNKLFNVTNLARVLIDTGSNVSLITRSLSAKLQLVGRPQSFSLNVAGSKKIHSQEQEVTFWLKNSTTKEMWDLHFAHVAAITIASIGADLPSIDWNPRDFHHLRKIKFSESFPTGPRRIDVLLGEPYASKLLNCQRVQDGDDEPAVFLTKLGPALCGSYNEDDKIPYPHAYTAFADVEEIWQQMWNLSNLGITDSTADGSESKMRECDSKALQLMQQHSLYDSVAKRWSTKLLFDDSSTEAKVLDDGYARARAIMVATERKVRADIRPLVSEAYGDFLVHNQAEIVPKELEARSDHPTYVLPSRPVINLGREKTKVRIIMNASAMSKSTNTTLNKLLLQGPNLLPHVPAVLMRFRHKKYIFCLDVRKMFLQVELRDEEDRDMCRYIWRDFEDRRPTMFRHKVLPFGFVSSPFQAIWCVQKTAEMFQKDFPLAHQSLTTNLYMDDIVDGAGSVAAARSMCTETVRVLELGGFKSHQACSNHVSVLDDLDDEQINNKELTKVLGHLWQTKQDLLQFDLEEKFPSAEEFLKMTISRRVIVSYASMIFDTLGLVLPFQMQIRAIIPHLWANNISWDESLENRIFKDENNEKKADDIATAAVGIFRKWCAEIPLLSRISVRRFLHATEHVRRLLVFGDASQMAFGVAVYSLRGNDGKVQVDLEFSRARLAPKAFREKLKGGDVLTIARLELSAMVIGVAAAEYVCKNIGYDMSNVIYFTDSLLNLQRVQAGASSCLRWEAARVRSVLEKSAESQWRFCPGIVNPADIVSRGSTVIDLLGKNKRLWFHGPEFLRLPENQWPQQPIPKSIRDKSANSAETKKFWEEKDAENIHISAIQAISFKINAGVENFQSELDWIDGIFKRKSSFRSATRIIARIIGWARSKKIPDQSASDPPSVQTLWRAQMLIFKRAQQLHLPNDYKLALAKATKQEADTAVYSPALRHIDVFYDKITGLLRHRTRLYRAEALQYDFSNPIVLPRCDFTAAKIQQVHSDYFHLAKLSTFHMLRERFHIVGGLEYVGGILRKCAEPRCRKTKCFETRMDPLPVERLDTPNVFKYVSVDLMGPFYVQHACTDTLAFQNAKKKLKFSKNDLPKAEKEAKLRDLRNNCPHSDAEGHAKVWGCLFVCFHSRAVHLELLRDSSTQHFIYALERFVGRRGRPEMIYSDNAPNFKAADRELKQMYRKIDFKAVKNAGILGAKSSPMQWQFSTEKAAWTNGITERLVQSVKRALRPTLLREVVSFERLEAILIGIEGILNCRPLATASSADPDLAAPITPSLLMYGKNMLPLEDPPRAMRIDESHMPDITRSMKVRQRFLNAFWRRWRKEYLTRFDVAKCWSKPQDNKLNVGDVVVIIDPDSLRNDWRLARVIEPTFSKANNLIGAKVRTANGNILQRHLRNLAMLESTALFKGPLRPLEDEAVSPDPAQPPMPVPMEVDGQQKQYVSGDEGTVRARPDQSSAGRSDGLLSGNAVVQTQPEAKKHKRGKRKPRTKFKR